MTQKYIPEVYHPQTTIYLERTSSHFLKWCIFIMVIWVIKIDEKIGNPTHISDLTNYCHDESWKLLQDYGCWIYDDFIVGCKP